jgi:hypothetical protein
MAGGKWLVFQRPAEMGTSWVTLIENVPMGASPRDYLRQLTNLLEDTEVFPIIYVQVLQGNFSEGLLEVFDFRGCRLDVEKVRLV